MRDANARDNPSAACTPDRGSHSTRLVSARGGRTYRYNPCQCEPLGARCDEAKPLLSAQALRPLRQDGAGPRSTSGPPPTYPHAFRASARHCPYIFVTRVGERGIVRSCHSSSPRDTADWPRGRPGASQAAAASWRQHCANSPQRPARRGQDRPLDSYRARP